MAEKVPIDAGDYGEVRDGYVKMESLAAAFGWVFRGSTESETDIHVTYSTPLGYEYEEDGEWVPLMLGFSVVHYPKRDYTETNLWYDNPETGGFKWSSSDLSALPPYLDDAGNLWVPLEPALAGAGIYFDGDSLYQDLKYARESSTGYVANIRPLAGESTTDKPVSADSAALARPTSAAVLVDGKTVAFDAYNIGGNNYFKLRDIAYTLNGTTNQFDVGWDGAANAIALASGEPYTAVGGEMASKGAGDKTATPTSSKITLNGNDVLFTAYNIDGNNYFKLRDIGQAFNFGVDWDGAEQTITIDTSKGYTPE
jgi:hypothetical protein